MDEDRTNDPQDAAPGDEVPQSQSSPWFDAFPPGESTTHRVGTGDAPATDVTPTDVPPGEVATRRRRTHGLLRHRGLQKTAALTALVIATAATTGVVVHSLDDHSTPVVRSSVASVAKTQTTTTIKAAIAKITPSVVLIKDTITSSGRGGFGGPGSFGNSTTTAAGTGMIISSDGLVLTNAHVVNGATNITVTMSDGSTHSASIVGLDATADIAVVKIANVSGLTPVTFAKSADVQVGDAVIAVGNAEALGNTPSVTAGIISATNRTLSDSSESLTGLLQTDAAISPGNSGGPLVDSNGDVVGMNTAVETGTSSEPAANIGFAIPSDTLTKALPDLEAGKSNGSSGSTNSNRGFLGVSVTDADSGGASVDSVQSGSPADQAGIQQGDVITAVDGKQVADANTLVSILSSDTPGTTVTVTVSRDGGSKQFKVKLGSANSTTG